MLCVFTVCVCVFILLFAVCCKFLFLFFWALFYSGGRTKVVIYIFSVVVSDLGSHIAICIIHECNLDFCNIFIECVHGSEAGSAGSHSWGNVQYHFFPLKCVQFFLYSAVALDVLVLSIHIFFVLFLSLAFFSLFFVVFLFEKWSENYIFYILCTGWFLWLLRH